MARRRQNISALTAVVIFACSSTALGHGRIPDTTPIDRILANLEAKLIKLPDDPELHYRIGRAHGLAIELKTETVAVWNNNDDLEIAERCWNWRDNKDEPKQTEQQLLTHLNNAVTHLSRAIELAPRRARYHLALASALETGLPLASKATAFPRVPTKPSPWVTDRGIAPSIDRLSGEKSTLSTVRYFLAKPDDEEGRSTRAEATILLLAAVKGNDKAKAEAARLLLSESWREQIGEEYFRALCLSLPKHSVITEKWIWGNMECLVSIDAAKSYVRVVKGGVVKQDHPVRRAVAKATVAAFDDLPRPNAITPIIFPVDQPRPLKSLLDESTTVKFDLDASGLGLEWPWVGAKTGVLVWDPRGTGDIRDGRQLFGSVSWWIFFDNGYEALDALDDNRDGLIAGSELVGIGVWVDANGNGVSDSGEVSPAAEYGIRSISARTTYTEDSCPANHAGLTMTDGRVLPTYDWIVAPAKPSAASRMANNVRKTVKAEFAP